MRCQSCGKQCNGDYCSMHDPKQSKFTTLTTSLTDIEKEVLANTSIQKINLNSKVVFGYGTGVNKIVILGEAPSMKGGAITGEPFTSPYSGRLMTQILKEADIRKEDCFVSNVCFVGLTENRTPTYQEMSLCWSYLARAMDILQPNLIIVLGTTAKQFFESKYIVSNLRKTNVVYLVHPSYVLRKGEEAITNYKQRFLEVLNAKRI